MGKGFSENGGGDGTNDGGEDEQSTRGTRGGKLLTQKV